MNWTRCALIASRRREPIHPGFTALNLFFTATLAYVLARRGLPGRVGMTLFVFVTMIISGGLIPTSS